MSKAERMSQWRLSRQLFKPEELDASAPRASGASSPAFGTATDSPSRVGLLGVGAHADESPRQPSPRASLPPPPTSPDAHAELFPWTILDRDDALPDRPSPSSSLVGTPIRAPRDAARVASRARVRVAVLAGRVAEPTDDDPSGVPAVVFEPERARVLLRRDRWDGTRFDLDDVFPSDAARRVVYERIAADATRAALAGDLAAVIACGSSRAGKTRVLGLSPDDDGSGSGSGSGSEYESDPDSNVDASDDAYAAADRGIASRALETLMAAAAASKGSVTVRLSYVLARGERAYDLLRGRRARVDALRVARGSDRGVGGRARASGATSTEVATLAEAVASIRVGEANRRRANRFAGGVVRGSHAHAVLYADVRVDATDGTTTLGTLALVDVGDFFAPNADDLAEIRRRATGDDGYSLDGVDGVPRGALARLLGDFLAPDKVVGWIFAVDPRRSRVEETAATLAFARDVRESAARRLRPRVGRRRIGFGSGSDRGVDVDVSARTSPENVSRRDVSARTSPENVSYRAVAREVHRVSRELDAELARRASAERRAEEATREAATLRAALEETRERFAEASMAREAAEVTCRALAEEMHDAAKRVLDEEVRRQTARDDERRRLAERWERDEDRREEEEDRWRAATEAAEAERDELAEAAAAERARWEARNAAAEASLAAAQASWEVERAALVAAAEETSTDPRRGAERARTAAALAAAATERVVELERERVLAETEAERRRLASETLAARRLAREDAIEETARLRAELAACLRRLADAEANAVDDDGNRRRRAPVASPPSGAVSEKEMETLRGCVSRANERAAAAEANAERFRAEAEDVARGAAAAAADVEARVRERVEAEAAAKFAAIADEFDADVEALETRLVRAETAAIRGERAAERATSALEAWWIREASRRAAAAEEREASRRDAAERRAAWARREARLHETFHDELRRRLDDGGAKWTGGTPWKWAHGDLDEEDATTEATLEARAATEARRRDATTTVFARVDRLEGVVELAAHDRAEIRRRAVRIVAAVAADPRGDAARRVVEAGAAKALLRVIGGGFGDGSDDESARRDAVGALANLAAAETNHAAMLDAGALEMVALFARNARDAASLRAAAAAAANLCGGGEVDVAGDAEGERFRAAGGPELLLRLLDQPGDAAANAEVRAHAALGVARLAGRAAGRRWLVAAGATPRVAAAAARAEPATARRAAKALCLMASSEEGAAEVRDDPDARRVVERVAKEAGRGSAARRKAEGAMAERITESAEELATDSCDRATNQTIHT